MIGPALKNYMPRSLFGRAVLIVMVPVGTILIVMSVVFVQRLYEDVTRQMTQVLGNELQLVIDRIDAAPDVAEGLSSAIQVAEPLGINVRPSTGFERDLIGLFDLSGRVVIETLRETLPGVAAVDLVSEEKQVLIAVETRKGDVVLDVSRRRLTARNPHQFLVVIGFTAVLMTMIALIYLRNQVRPIRRLATAAEAFGRGRMVPYRPSGASEVRAAGGAFLKMRDRIEAQIDQRTMMLSSVSHDLRTPLTRMKLALGMMEESDETHALRQDVDDMEEMLRTFLNFARGDALEDPERCEPADIAEAAVERAQRAELPVFSGNLDRNVTFMLRPASLGRALDNLIGNAVRYGKRAVVSVKLNEKDIIILVEDDGPGIPEDARNKAQEPFNRLDVARNQDSGTGVGLGLAIAADIARQHGGKLLLGESAEFGGLRAEIALPR